MKRLLAVTIGVLVAVVAALVLVSTFSASRRHIDESSAPVADVVDIPIALKQRADCMYQALTTIPGVHQPRQGRVTSKEWTHPFLEYSATVNYVDNGGATMRVYPMRFEAQRDGLNHDEYWYWFLASFAGPPPPGFDMDQADSIVRVWGANCHVYAEIQIN